MVRAAAAETPEWDWIIAGSQESVRPRGPENLHWVGRVPYEKLPGWLQHFDVGIVPYMPTLPFNRFAWPSKLMEYVAAGLPVVSTDIPAARDLAARLGEQVTICDEPTSRRFVACVRAALELPRWRCEAGRSFAYRRSWQDRATQVLNVLDRMES
jgi:teichuronic acid biosynthesis glycosyltransferase TuaH